MKISETRLQNFRRVLADKKLRLVDVADALGKAPAQVSSFGGKNPTKGIGDQIAREFEKAFGLHRGYLDMPHGVGELNTTTVLSHTGRTLPVITPNMAVEWHDSGRLADTRDVCEWIEAPGPVGAQAFVLVVEGISMEPKLSNGDKVVIDPALEALPGQIIALMRTQDKAVILRQLMMEGNEQYLLALNPNWPERILKMTNDWSICGRARWKISDL
ncbi:S24 family peptidase [Pseudomonas alliivorans]|nr:S24 family peptidase [Pseudomonas alliivorans]